MARYFRLWSVELLGKGGSNASEFSIVVVNIYANFNKCTSREQSANNIRKLHSQGVVDLREVELRISHGLSSDQFYFHQQHLNLHIE